MTLYQFIALDKAQQAKEAWQEVYLMSREEEEYTVMLYKVHFFYVEIYYTAESNNISSVLAPKWLE